MRKKRHSAEEIVNNLREADVELSRGQTVPQACQKIAVTESAAAYTAGGVVSMAG